MTVHVDGFEAVQLALLLSRLSLLELFVGLAQLLGLVLTPLRLHTLRQLAISAVRICHLAVRARCSRLTGSADI